MNREKTIENIKQKFVEHLYLFVNDIKADIIVLAMTQGQKGAGDNTEGKEENETEKNRK